MHPKPARFPWGEQFPPVLVHAQKSEVTTHPWFAAARSGDVDAAALLVADTCSGEVVDRLAALAGNEKPILASVHACNREGLNVLPDVLAHGLQRLLGWEVDTGIVQGNIAGFARDLAVFDGAVEEGGAYVLVDDFIRRGTTLASLRGHILGHGGRVLAATVLTGAAAGPGHGPKRLGVRDEPGIGAFVVELRLDGGTGPRMLSADEIGRLRAGRRIVAERARAIFVVRPEMAPPVLGAVDT